MDSYILVYTYNEVLQSNEKGWATAIWINMNDSHQQDVDHKKTKEVQNKQKQKNNKDQRENK